MASSLVLPVLEDGPDHGQDVHDEGDDDHDIDGHVVLEGGVREHEVKVDGVHLGEPGGAERRKMVRAARAHQLGRVVRLAGNDRDGYCR